MTVEDGIFLGPDNDGITATIGFEACAQAQAFVCVEGAEEVLEIVTDFRHDISLIKRTGALDGVAVFGGRPVHDACSLTAICQPHGHCTRFRGACQVGNWARRHWLFTRRERARC